MNSIKYTWISALRWLRRTTLQRKLKINIPGWYDKRNILSKTRPMFSSGLFKAVNNEMKQMLSKRN